MIYMLVPHEARSWEDFRMFTSYSAAEQIILHTARALSREGHSPDWCSLIAYEGLDEIHPVFVYSIVAGRLLREKWVSPSP